jgi:hypothetical protein
LAFEPSRVFNLLNKVFLFTTHLHRWRAPWGSTWNLIRLVPFKKADMENWVDLVVLRQVQVVRMIIHLLKDLEGSKLLVVEFLCWSSCVDVLGVEPDLVSNLEVGLDHGLCVIVLGMSL